MEHRDEATPGSHLRPCCTAAIEQYKQGLIDAEARRLAKLEEERVLRSAASFGSQDNYFSIMIPLAWVIAIPYLYAADPPQIWTIYEFTKLFASVISVGLALWLFASSLKKLHLAKKKYRLYLEERGTQLSKTGAA